MILKNLKIALVCDWLTTSGGAEKVIVGLHQLFPFAPIYTSIYNPEAIQGLEKAQIHTSYLQHLPLAKKKHQLFIKLLPSIFENFDLTQYDIVISSSHSCAKGIITKPETLHISYCHSPMRYAWENSQTYIKEYQTSFFIKKLAPFLIHKLRIWDKLSSDRVDSFIANSKHVQKRIRKYYRKDSEIIYPFIDNKSFQSTLPRKEFFLAVGRLTAYKKFDLIIKAFNQLGLPIKIVGKGNCEKKLKEIAHENIQFLGFVSDSELKKLYSEAKALIFPQSEDFGIIPLEAMASGCPVLAYKNGGALETIVDQKTGIFFEKQTSEAIIEVVKKSQNTNFDSNFIANHTRQFDRSIFNQAILNFIEKEWENWHSKIAK